VDVLIIGSGGMLGYITYQYLKDQGYQVSGVTQTKPFPDMLHLDATDEQALRGLLDQVHFDVIINCAALLLKPSEERKCDAVKLNSWLPQFLAAYCEQHHTYLIQVSTDAVFSGLRGQYQENDPSDANTFYGKSKFLGEVDNDSALTVRSGLWGLDINPNGTGLLQWFMRQRDSVSGYANALFNGVSNLEFAKFADAAIRSRWTGIYHLHAADETSKYEFLCLAKSMFCSPATIFRDESVQIDRTLKCVRTDIPYQQKTFKQMLEELKQWWTVRSGFPA